MSDVRNEYTFSGGCVSVCQREKVVLSIQRIRKLDMISEAFSCLMAVLNTNQCTFIHLLQEYQARFKVKVTCNYLTMTRP